LLDEICGWVVSRKLQTTGVTSKMETRYLKPVSTEEEYLVLRASIKEQRRNIVIIEASLYNSQQVLCSQAVCTYFTLSPEKAKEQMHFPGCEVEEEEVNPLI
jgi:acyl-coenzyme A thioesterase PaaI-like protein